MRLKVVVVMKKAEAQHGKERVGSWERIWWRLKVEPVKGSGLRERK